MKVLDKSDVNKLIELYRLAGLYNENKMVKIITNMNKYIFLYAQIEGDRITNLISLYLNNNDYYINEIITLDGKLNELFILVIDYLKKENMALNIIYDNTPYRELVNDLLTGVGFKQNYIELMQEYTSIEMKPINKHIKLNDKSYQLIEYLKFKSGDNNINIDNLNTAVIKDNKILGVVSFSKINDNIVLSNLYGEEECYIIDLINLIRNLTNKNIEITIKGNDEFLNEILNKLGFRKISSDYTYKLENN